MNKGEVRKCSIGNKRGWCFVVGTNFVSALYKTKGETKLKLNKYLTTGKFDWYGSAE